MNPEIWRDVKGLEGIYQVSNNGDVRNAASGYILKRQSNKGGYEYVGISIRPGVHRCRLIHRLVAASFHPNPDAFPEVNHIDGNRTNNKAENLEWCSRQQNMDHAVRTGLMPLGEKSGQSKLKSTDVLAIREALANGQPLKPLARRFGISPKNIRDIRKGKIWKHCVAPVAEAPDAR